MAAVARADHLESTAQPRVATDGHPVIHRLRPRPFRRLELVEQTDDLGSLIIGLVTQHPVAPYGSYANLSNRCFTPVKGIDLLRSNGVKT